MLESVMLSCSLLIDNLREIEQIRYMTKIGINTNWLQVIIVVRLREVDNGTTVSSGFAF